MARKVKKAALLDEKRMERYVLHKASLANMINCSMKRGWKDYYTYEPP